MVRKSVSLVLLVMSPTRPEQIVLLVPLVNIPLMVWLANLAQLVVFLLVLLPPSVPSVSVVSRLIMIVLCAVLVLLVPSRIMMALVRLVLLVSIVLPRPLATATSVLLVMRPLLTVLAVTSAVPDNILPMVLPVNLVNLDTFPLMLVLLNALLVLWAMVTLPTLLCVALVLLVPLLILERLVPLASLVRFPMLVDLACLVLLVKETLVLLIPATLVLRDLAPWREVSASVVPREVFLDRVVSVCLVLLVMNPTLGRPLVLNVLKEPSLRMVSLVSLVRSVNSLLVPVPSNASSAVLEALPTPLVRPVFFARLVSAL